MNLPDDYKIPDEPVRGQYDAAYLRSCMGLRAKPGEDPPPLPESVRLAHYVVSRTLSILGATGSGMDPNQLAMVAAFAMYHGADVQEEKTTYAFPAEEAEPGQKVVVKYRQRDRAAHFMEIRKGRIVVLHEGKELKMRPDNVRFPEDGEFPDVAANLNQQV